MNLRVLFVDDDPNVLDGLRRMLRSLRHEWEMDFVNSGAAALELLEVKKHDVVVSDLRMPGMDGSQLLAEVMRRYPNTVRIILSGHSDKEMTLRTVGPAHQYLAKPSDPETIKKTIFRSCELRDILHSDSLRTLISSISGLPSIPSLYLELLDVLQSPAVSVVRVGGVIAKDLGMSTKILQLVNSAFFGLGRPVADTVQAASLLGLDTIQALTLTVGVFSEVECNVSNHFSPENLWSHSLQVGTHTKRIAEAEKQDKKWIENAFMAGLLHDVGKLFLASKLPDQYDSALLLSMERKLPLFEAEKEVFGNTHAEVGAYLLGLWGLPQPILEALAYHHSPQSAPAREFTPLTVVYAVNLMAHEGADPESAHLLTGFDEGYLRESGVLERLPVWRELSVPAIKENRK